jgi:hypothetical protein
MKIKSKTNIKPAVAKAAGTQPTHEQPKNQPKTSACRRNPSPSASE